GDGGLDRGDDQLGADLAGVAANQDLAVADGDPVERPGVRVVETEQPGRRVAEPGPGELEVAGLDDESLVELGLPDEVVAQAEDAKRRIDVAGREDEA